MDSRGQLFSASEHYAFPTSAGNTLHSGHNTSINGISPVPRRMRPRIENSIGDDAMESCGYLKFTDQNMRSSFLQSLSTMRKNRLFCDVILLVENTEIHAHRNVLACVSPQLMELFSTDAGTLNGAAAASDAKLPCYRLNGQITKPGLKYLVEYAYTGSLEVPDEMIRDVYLAAWQLKIDSVVKECARHLVGELEPDICIETRSLPGIERNRRFVQEVDAYIAKHFQLVSETAGFLQLPCILIEVLYQTRQEMSVVAESSLGRLVVDWIRRQMTEEDVSVATLLERSHMLYLALDNSLQDCADLPPGQESESDLVQDYKRLVLKGPINKKHRKALKTPGRPRMILYSRDIGDRSDTPEEAAPIEMDWSLVGCSKLSDHTYVALVTLNGNLMRLSIQLRLNVPTTPSPINTPDVMSTSVSRDEDLDECQRPELFCEVATMSGPKCGLGVAELEGKLLVCGGYDRAECLRSVESYCPETNSWTQQSNMGEARGRVQIAVIDGTVYAVGGCNGTTELDSVEYLAKSERKWKKMCKLPLARSNAGVCALSGKIYCIGGWNGQSGIKQCDVLKPDENRWYSIAPLHTGRYQAGVTAFGGNLWVVGGSDAWNCLASVEVYDPEANQWTFGPPLSTARRGCGLAEFNGKLYAVGGSDGTHSLNTTECYDEESKCWNAGPNLTLPRSNVSVAVVQGRLYAIGGFSGKTFLSTVEYLDPATNEWTTFVPQTSANIDSLLENSLRAALQNVQRSSSSTSSSPDHLTGNGGASETTFKPIHTAMNNEYNRQQHTPKATVAEATRDILYVAKEGTTTTMTTVAAPPALSPTVVSTKTALLDDDEDVVTLHDLNGDLNGANQPENSISLLQQLAANKCTAIANGGSHSS